MIGGEHWPVSENANKVGEWVRSGREELRGRGCKDGEDVKALSSGLSPTAWEEASHGLLRAQPPHGEQLDPKK